MEARQVSYDDDNYNYERKAKFSTMWKNSKKGDFKVNSADTNPNSFWYPTRGTELVAASRSRFWRNMLAGTMVVMLIVTCGLAVAYVTTAHRAVPAKTPQVAESPRQARFTSSLTSTKISLDDVLKGKFQPSFFNGTWISDSEFMYQSLEKGSLNIFNVNELSTSVIVSASIMNKWRPFKYDLSPSRRYILLVHEVQKLFRYSYLARHTIINLVTGEVIHLAPQRVHSRLEQPPLLYAEWAPKTDALAFVFHNDLYYVTSPNLTEMYRITDTGQIGTVFNAIPDWVYEEEIVNSNSAMWFSPDGRKLSFATFNDSTVDTMNFPLYGRPGDPLFQYPLQQSIKYPKPGRNNPIVDLWILDIDNLLEGKTETVARMPPPASLASRDHYFTAVTWTNNKKLAVMWMNRHQNESIISICDAIGNCNEDLAHVSPDLAWNDLYKPPIFDNSGDSYLIILPTLQGSDAGHFKHINLRNVKTKELIPITTGLYEVVEILSWDQNRNIIYFTGAPAGKPGQRHLFYVFDLKSNSPKSTFCITCGFKNDYSEDCNYNDGDMSKKSKYYVLSCNGPGIPQTTIHRSENHSRLALLEDNNDIRELLHNKDLPLEKRLEIDVEDGFKAQVSMKLPPDYGKNSSKKYPMLVYVYGGPGSQLVSDRFKIDWGDYLASQKDIIYVSIDGRGSGFAGDKKLHALYRKLGSVEVEDQIKVTKAILNSFPKIDDSKTAIWGWSYGGYVTASVMSKDTKNIFKCGISVAPVTSWLYYDTAYTERFMGLPTPEDNLRVYKDSDVTLHVENFRKKKFFLIHGTADDNVHYQQSMMLARALEVNDILFSAQSYPDENHGLAGVKKHHYHSMGAFLDQCFS